MKELVLAKLFSGRFLLTTVCGLTFAYLSCTGKLDPAAASAILLLVFKSYFDRGKIADEQASQTQPPKP